MKFFSLSSTLPVMRQYLQIIFLLLLHITHSVFGADFSNGVTDQINQKYVITPSQNPLEISTILNGPNEKVVQLAKAQVVYADYILLKIDFPSLQNLSNKEIDRWILQQTGYISVPQSEQTEVNSTIPVTNKYRTANRAQTYNRTLIYQVSSPTDARQTIGHIDVKGTGSLMPRQANHGNGLMTLGEAIADTIHEAATREVLLNAGISIQNVGTYAVISAGFDVVHSDGSKSPAGLLLRQLHNRNGSSKTPRKVILDVYKRYGVSVDGNLQVSQGIWDFGHYVYEQKFEKKNVEEVFQLPWREFGYDEELADKHPKKDSWYKSKLHRVWIYSHDTAKYVAEHPEDRTAVTNTLQNLVGSAQIKLRSNVLATGNQLKDRIKKWFKSIAEDESMLKNSELILDLKMDFLFLTAHGFLNESERNLIFDSKVWQRLFERDSNFFYNSDILNIRTRPNAVTQDFFINYFISLYEYSVNHAGGTHDLEFFKYYPEVLLNEPKEKLLAWFAIDSARYAIFKPEDQKRIEEKVKAYQGSMLMCRKALLKGFGF